MSRETFEEKVERHRALLNRRGRGPAKRNLCEVVLAAEHMPPTGQAYDWYADVIYNVPKSGRQVAKQLARLCGDDSKVTLPWRSLADAVGHADRVGRTRAYAERGVAALVEAGWLRVETVGAKRGARTTFYLLAGEHLDHEPWWMDADPDDLEEWAAA